MNVTVKPNQINDGGRPATAGGAGLVGSLACGGRDRDSNEPRIRQRSVDPTTYAEPINKHRVFVELV
jgi:hypothetical protein